MKLNMDKTEALCIGFLTGSKFKIKGIKWATGPIRYLGIYMSTNKKSCEALHWDNKLKMLKSF